MKKKGLIVATIVMVLVLAVSLTTATYAWFTTVSKTTVENIEFSVGADSDVNIGLLTNHKLNTNSTNATINSGKTANDFMWGDMSFDASTGTWSGGTVGLGYMIDTQLQLNGIKKAVGTGVVADPDADPAVAESIDTSWNSAHTIVTATAGETSLVGKEATAAKMQTDYLDVIFGVNASKENVEQILCVVTVNPTLGSVLGMNAAIHVRWSLNGTNYYDCDVYSPENTSGATYSLTTANAYSATLDKAGAAIGKTGTHGTYTAGAGYLGQEIAVNQGWASITIPVVTADVDETLPTNGTPAQIHLQIFIAGYDTDCCNEAMGVASEILINFVAVKSDSVGA